MVFFIITVAAAEVAVGLALIVALFRNAKPPMWRSNDDEIIAAMNTRTSRG